MLTNQSTHTQNSTDDIRMLVNIRMLHDNFEDGLMVHPSVSLCDINFLLDLKQKKDKRTTDESICTTTTTPESVTAPNPQPSASNTSESPQHQSTSIPDDFTHIIVPVKISLM